MSHSVVVRSVGNANPHVAVAIAHGLGLPVDRALQTIYRAPARLVSALDEQGADRLAGLLRTTGLDVDVVLDNADVVPAELFDVAVTLGRNAPLLSCLKAIASFCACDEKRALDLLSRPPGVVLGSVSRSTAKALEQALAPFDARVVAAPLERSRYLAFATTDSAPLASSIQQSIKSELTSVTQDKADENGPTLSFAASQRLWSRFGRMGALRIVNEAFLAFDICLEGTFPDRHPDLSVLERLAGIPPRHFAAVIAAAPVTLERAVGFSDLAERLEAYALAGLKVRGEMSSFARARVRLTHGAQGAMVQSVATLFDLPVAIAFPWQSADMAQTRASLLVSALEAAGARAELVEVDDG